MMQVQYKNIKGNDLEQFRGMDTQTIVAPAETRDRRSDRAVREGAAVSNR